MGELHRVGAERITTQGLSPVARWILAFFSALFGLIMLFTAPDDGKAKYFYCFGLLCFVIALACITRGRLRQFFGSLIGITLFVISLWFLYSEATSGHVLTRGPGDPSLIGAILFTIAFGAPGL